MALTTSENAFLVTSTPATQTELSSYALGHNIQQRSCLIHSAGILQFMPSVVDGADFKVILPSNVVNG